MEYLWIAGVTAMIAQSAFGTLLMYLFLFYACRRIKEPVFARIVPWTLAAIGVCVLGSFAPHFFSQHKAVAVCFAIVQEILYCYIWYQCLAGIGRMEAIYGDLNGYGLRRVYWAEVVLAAWVLFLFVDPHLDALEQSAQIALVLVQAWKAYLLYHTYRNSMIREKQLFMLAQEAEGS